MMTKRAFLLLIVFLLTTIVLAQDSVLTVTPVSETVESRGDGANGVAIWIHPIDPSQSLILGADDNEGLGVYDLDGKLLQFAEDAAGINNLDLRYNFLLGSQRVALVAAAVSDTPRIDLFTINPDTRTLERLGWIDTIMWANSVCLYISPLTDTYYVIGLSETGEFEQYAVESEDGELRMTLARAISVGTEVEGCAVDDTLRRIYIAEEETPVIWRYGAEPEDGDLRHIVEAGNGRIVEQVEGLALLNLGEQAGYLLAANEQNDSVLVYERAGDNAFVGEFKLGAGEGVDSVTEPNGLDVVNFPLGESFPQGLFVTSDDVNSQPNADNNYKLVSWADVVSGLNLVSNPTYDPRREGLTEADASDVVGIPAVTARLETAPVPAGTDAADDPAIWIHPTDMDLSTIIGTDKTTGLVVYALDGSIIQEVNIGRVNNVDLRYNYQRDGESVAIVAATNRSNNSLILFTVDAATRQLVPYGNPIPSAVEEVYGVCLYVSPTSGTHYAFVNSADTGQVEQYALIDEAGSPRTEIVREFVVGSQTEGCVADDETGILYIGEEGRGIWRYGAEPDQGDTRIQVDITGAGGNLTADVEGLALYYGPDGTGYLIASSQGSSTFVVYERAGENAYLGTFRVLENEVADAVSGTDGLDVTNFPLGNTFPQGLLVVQDDLNLAPGAGQNFKLIGWEDVAAALGLLVDTSVDPRSFGGG
jgi:3-phytase